ncbi:branched-chain amino acid ABC transporter substrate-binding protein [Halobacteriales archaeon QS_8_69_26]|nr:MAG: branched-chain amino acid ABC transporter substrate-binding protein [Halobacteriales archaeon QS_8_69_26]
MVRRSSTSGESTGSYRRITRRRALSAIGATATATMAGCLDGGGGGDGDGGTDTTTDGGGGNGTTDGMEGTTAGTTVTGPEGTVRIGVVQPLSGDLSYYGQSAIWGFASGLAYKTDTDPIPEVTTGEHVVEAGDVTYELEVRDTELNPDTAQERATQLVDQDDVDILFGPTSSGAAERIISTVVRPSGTPIMVGPAASTSITSEAEYCGDMVFRASENTAMDARSGGTYAADNTDISTVFLMGADYSFGRSVVSNYKSVLQEKDIEIVGERYVPQGHEDFDGLFQNAQDAGADAVVGGFTVATLPAFMTTAANYDMRIFGGFATQITNGIVGDVLKNLLGEPLTAQKIKDAKIGPFTTRYHWNQYDNSINDEFVQMHTETYGLVPDLFASGVFTGASAIVQAVNESGSTGGADIANQIQGMAVTDTPKGENGYLFQGYNNQARSEMTVAYPVPTSDEWAENWGASIMPESPPTARVSSDFTTIPADSDMMNCSL